MDQRVNGGKKLAGKLCLLTVAACAAGSSVAAASFSSHIYVLSSVPFAPRTAEVFYRSSLSGLRNDMSIDASYNTGPVTGPNGEALGNKTGEGSVSTDLAHGLFRNYARTDAIPARSGQVLTETATLYMDDLNFHVQGAFADTVTPVHLLLSTRGMLTRSPEPTQTAEGSGFQGWLRLTTQSGVTASGRPTYTTATGWTEDTCGRTTCTAQTPLNNYQDPSLWSATITNGLLSGESDVVDVTALLRGSDTSYHMTINLQTFARGATADFLHTTQFSIVAPEGVSWSTSSGLLLAVPEPATALEMLAGLVSLGALLRRHHASKRGDRLHAA